MMFVCYYVIIPFQPQYLPRHAPQGAGIQGAGIGVPKLSTFHYCPDMPLRVEGSKVEGSVAQNPSISTTDGDLSRAKVIVI